MLPRYISRYVEIYDIAVIAIYRDIIDFYISRYISRQHWGGVDDVAFGD